MLDIWCDGSCKGQCGGWAFLLDDKLYSGKVYPATNNRMELRAIEQALATCLENFDDREVRIFTDSKYAIGVSTGESRAKANIELVNSIRKKLKKFVKFEFVYVDERDSANIKKCHNTAIGQAEVCSELDHSDVTVSVPLPIVEELEDFLKENNGPPRLLRAVKQSKSKQ